MKNKQHLISIVDGTFTFSELVSLMSMLPKSKTLLIYISDLYDHFWVYKFEEVETRRHSQSSLVFMGMAGDFIKALINDVSRMRENYDALPES